MDKKFIVTNFLYYFDFIIFERTNKRKNKNRSKSIYLYDLKKQKLLKH